MSKVRAHCGICGAYDGKHLDECRIAALKQKWLEEREARGVKIGYQWSHRFNQSDRDATKEAAIREGFLAGLAAARPRWVPVSERPPSENDAYVVLFRDGDDLVRDVCVFHNGEWDLNTCYGNSISYWLEGLPEDPAPETEGE